MQSPTPHISSRIAISQTYRSRRNIFQVSRGPSSRNIETLNFFRVPKCPLEHGLKLSNAYISKEGYCVLASIANVFFGITRRSGLNIFDPNTTRWVSGSSGNKRKSGFGGATPLDLRMKDAGTLFALLFGASCTAALQPAAEASYFAVFIALLAHELCLFTASSAAYSSFQWHLHSLS